MHLAAYLAMVVIVLTVWLVVGLTAGAWYFWPIWPMLGWGIGLASHGLATLGRANAGSGWRDHRAAREMA